MTSDFIRTVYAYEPSICTYQGVIYDIIDMCALRISDITEDHTDRGLTMSSVFTYCYYISSHTVASQLPPLFIYQKCDVY